MPEVPSRVGITSVGNRLFRKALRLGAWAAASLAFLFLLLVALPGPWLGAFGTWAAYPLGIPLHIGSWDLQLLGGMEFRDLRLEPARLGALNLEGGLKGFRVKPS